MRWLVLLFVLVQAQGNAADFRTSSFGESCEALTEREASLGAQPVESKVTEPGVHTFKAVVFGHDVSVVYLCSEGLLRIGNYLFPRTDRGEAIKVYGVVYASLVSSYGLPATDLEFGATGTYAGSSLRERQRLYASWTMPDLSAWVSLAPNGPAEGPNWKVLVVFSEGSESKGSNKRLQPIAPTDGTPAERQR